MTEISPGRRVRQFWVRPGYALARQSTHKFWRSPLRKLIVVACLLGLLAVSAFAAEGGDAPKTEVFGGYQYSHLSGGINANGWDVAVNGNFNNYFGITGDLGAADR